MFDIEVNEIDEVEFNYFYKQFLQKYNNRVMKISEDRIGNDDMIAIFQLITTEEKLNIQKQLLYEMCEDYITLSGSNIKVYPTNVLEFVNLILDNIHENKYKNSFLFSIQFVYQELFASLGHDYIELWSLKSDEDPSMLEVTVNRQDKICKFGSCNMDMLEQDKVMTNILKMEIDGSIGPLPKVKFIKRNDI